MSTESHVAENIKTVNEHIKAICAECGRTENPPRLVAVSKTKPISAVQEAYDIGQRHFGENYVVELSEKSKALESLADIKWHFIGHLQSNKAKIVCRTPNLFVIETIDTEKLAKIVNKEWIAHRGDAEKKLNVMIQVNTSGEEQKSGVSPDNVKALADVIAKECTGLNLMGLMTIGESGNGDHDFGELKRCRDEILGDPTLELSMGRSADYDMAIRYGSTNVRVGSTIFGARYYPPKN